VVIALTARDVIQMIDDAMGDYKKLISALELVMRDLDYVVDFGKMRGFLGFWMS